MIHTFHDLVSSTLNYLAKDSKESPEVKRIILNAYRVVSNKREWNYYKRFIRLNTVAAQSSGTIQYTNSTRTVVLTGATWPSWAASAFLRIGQVDYYVDTLVDSATIILSASSNPGADVAALTQYILAQDSYLLPADFVSIILMEWSTGTVYPVYIGVEQFANLSSLVNGPGTPYYYTIFGARQTLGGKTLRFYPAPDNIYPTNIIYNGRGRPLAIENYSDGTASVAASTTVTGAGTAWTSAMVGSIIRFWSDSTTYPTGVDDLYPAVFEATIVSVASATSLTVDSATTLTLSGVKYVISDPVDVAEGAMFNYLLREIDKQARLSMRSKPTGAEEQAEYDRSILEAMEADSVYAGTRIAGISGYRPRLLREYPINLGP